MNTDAWRKYLKNYSGHGKSVFFIGVVTVCVTLLQFPILLLIRYSFDVVIPSRNMSALFLIGLAIAAIYFVQSGVQVFIEYLVNKVTRSVISRIRKKILSCHYTYSREHTSQLDNRIVQTAITQDTLRLDYAAYTGLGKVLAATMIGLGMCVYLMVVNWVLFIAILLFAPLLYTLSKLVGKHLRHAYQKYHRSFEQFGKGVLFVLQFMDLTKQRAAQDVEIERQSKIIDQLAANGITLGVIGSLYNQANTVLVTISGVIIIIAGGSMVASGRMSLGELIAYFSAVVLLRRQVTTILSFIPKAMEADESLNTLTKMIETTELEPYSGKQAINFSGHITLYDVTFKYSNASTPVLRDIKLNILPGTCSLIIGDNGSGKTTLVNLITGFYKPQNGYITADEIDYSDLDMEIFRRQIGIVPQNPLLFPGTIRENILYGYESLPEQMLDSAIRKSLVADFLKDLPDGLETNLGENGQLLSGGQRQKIAIARAILTDPTLLILDEPTNHLDQKSIKQIVNNLFSGDSIPTILLISHRDFNMDLVDNILYLDQQTLKTDPLKSVKN